jgi:protein-tyrosine phosphatase
MIDVHCHLLPGIDDGPKDLATSLEMARIAVSDGIATIFCTPHIYPGLYENHAADIRDRVAKMQLILQDHGIPLTLNFGADVHLVPGLLDAIRKGVVPTLGDSRYLLVEPSHHVCPPRFKESIFALIASGCVPVITHPERLTWVEHHFDDFTSLARSGAWLQITGGALVGRFGKRVERIAEQFVGDGWAAVLASDAHTTGLRSPVLAEAELRAAQLVGKVEASMLVRGRPSAICTDTPAGSVPRPPALSERKSHNQGKIGKIFSGWLRR